MAFKTGLEAASNQKISTMKKRQNNRKRLSL